MQPLVAIVTAGTAISALGYFTYIGMAWGTTDSTEEGENLS